jgi:uncharacterized protein
MINISRSLFFLGMIAGAMTVNAAPVSAVNSTQCQLMAGQNQPFLLVLKKGEQVQQSILRCAEDAAIKGATVSGIGALKPATLLYFDHKTKQYHSKEIKQFMEVTNLTGNISKLNGDYINHLHITLADNNYQVQGGHLKDATVGAVLEIQITPMKGPLIKKYDEDTGLNVIQTP